MVEVDNYIEAGSKVVPVRASATAHPGEVVKVNDNGTLNICWRGTRDSIQYGARADRMRIYTGALPLYGPSRSRR